MESFTAALRVNNDGVEAFHSGYTEAAYNMFASSLRQIRESVIIMRNGEQQLTTTNPLNGGQTTSRPLFVRKLAIGTQQSFFQDFICAEAIVFSLGEITVPEAIALAHLYCAVVTFNISLLHHHRGLQFHHANLVSSSPDAAERAARFMSKSVRLYSMAHDLLFSEQVPEEMFLEERATLTWFIKLAILHNISQAHRINRSLDAARQGFQYLAWVANVADREACQAALGDELYGRILRSAMLHSMSIITATAA